MSILFWLYLIPFLHQTTTRKAQALQKLKLYLIPFLHQTTTATYRLFWCTRCILFHFYIKPQLKKFIISTEKRCILFHFYIKPQRLGDKDSRGGVVSYSISTSNHNCGKCASCLAAVVSYSISTSNHNVTRNGKATIRLYLIPFLHQTTTVQK